MTSEEAPSGLRSRSSCSSPIAFWMSLPPSLSRRLVLHPPPARRSSVLLTSFWQAYSPRLGLVVGFALAALAALGLSALARRDEGRGWHLLPPLALALVVCELLPGNIGAVDANTRPDWVNWLATHPHGIVATYPNTFGRLAAINLAKADYWYQRLDDDPLFEITGLSQAMLLSKTEAIRLVSSDIDRPLSAGVLATEGVRYAVVHDEAYRNERLPLPRPDRRHFTLLAAFAQVQIYSVHAGRVDIPQVLASEATEIRSSPGHQTARAALRARFRAGACSRRVPRTLATGYRGARGGRHRSRDTRDAHRKGVRELAAAPAREIESASGRILTRLEIPTRTSCASVRDRSEFPNCAPTRCSFGSCSRRAPRKQGAARSRAVSFSLVSPLPARSPSTRGRGTAERLLAVARPIAAEES